MLKVKVYGKEDNKSNIFIQEFEVREKEKQVPGILTGKNKANMLTSKKETHTY